MAPAKIWGQANVAANVPATTWQPKMFGMTANISLAAFIQSMQPSWGNFARNFLASVRHCNRIGQVVKGNRAPGTWLRVPEILSLNCPIFYHFFEIILDKLIILPINFMIKSIRLLSGLNGTFPSYLANLSSLTELYDRPFEVYEKL